MPLQLIQQDITKMTCDAIVNAANTSLLGGGGVDGAIHRAAGEELLEECKTLGGCATGQAKITRGYRLRAKYVIHTVGPVYRDGKHGEEALLRSCYEQSLALAAKYRCASVAFPLISSGAYGYPKEQALQVAMDAITAFLEDHDMWVYIVVLHRNTFCLNSERAADLAAFLEEQCEEIQTTSELLCPEEANFAVSCHHAKLCKPLQAEQSLADVPDFSEMRDESFSEMLLRKIDEKGLSDPEVYKKANIDRKLFSKIRSNAHYQPSKATAVTFAVALELPPDEFNEMLMKAGFALSRSYIFDCIIEYYVFRKGKYNIYEINEALFQYDQPLLGCRLTGDRRAVK